MNCFIISCICLLEPRLNPSPAVSHPADEELALVGVCDPEVIPQTWDEAFNTEVRGGCHNVLHKDRQSTLELVVASAVDSCDGRATGPISTLLLPTQ